MTVLKTLAVSHLKISFAICDSAGKFSICLREEENNQGTAANTAAASLLSSICNSTTSLRSLSLPLSLRLNPSLGILFFCYAAAPAFYCNREFSPVRPSVRFLFFRTQEHNPKRFCGLFRGQAFQEVLISHRNPSSTNLYQSFTTQF